MASVTRMSPATAFEGGYDETRKFSKPEYKAHVAHCEPGGRAYLARILE